MHFSLVTERLPPRRTHAAFYLLLDHSLPHYVLPARQVFKSMEECECHKDDTIIAAGQPGDWLYVVSSGVYDVHVNGNVVHTYTAGEEAAASFGELALLYGNNKRAVRPRHTPATPWPAPPPPSHTHCSYLHRLRSTAYRGKVSAYYV